MCKNMTRIDPLTQWSTPCSQVGTGFDIRSSENGLLTMMYGSLERASHFGWLNAGRTLVDKTYIQLLWQAKQLPSFGLTHHDIATQLELFIRAHLQPIWVDIDTITLVKKQKLANSLINIAASTLFGDRHQEQAASWLLFYLCPQLPIFPVTHRLLNAISQSHTLTSIKESHQTVDYNNNQIATRYLYEKSQPLNHYVLPTASYGNEKEQTIINTMLINSDWWSRYCFLHYLLAMEE